MLYQLPDGRTVDISISEYLDSTPEELQSLLGYDFGAIINNPHYGSVINKPCKESDDEPDWSGKDIQEVPNDEKFKDRDYKDEE